MKQKCIYLFYGKEHFLVDREISATIKMIENEAGQEVEVVYLDGDETGPAVLMEKLDFSPLFAMNRVLVVKRPYWLGSARRRGGRSEEISKVLLDYLQNPAPGQTIILTADEYSASHPLIKKIAPWTTKKQCPALSEEQLSNWLRQEFQDRGKTTTARVLKKLAASGQDMYYLHNLIDKLCLQVEDKKIGDADIDTELNTKQEIKVFKLTDAMLKRNSREALQAYNQLLEQGTHPIFILQIMVGQFMGMARVKQCAEDRVANQEIAGLAKVQPFMVRKLTDSAAKFSWEEIERLFRAFLDADLLFKQSGQDDRMVMETLILQICSGL